MNLFENLSLEIFITGFVSGILPALLWLFYWLRQDSKNPEPKKLILAVFVLGMIAVPISAQIQSFIKLLILGDPYVYTASIFFSSYTYAITIFILGSTVEEVIKYLAAWFGGLKRKANDEPIDSMIYLITAALGFAALENFLYIISPINEGIFDRILLGNSRFIGATLLHVATSGLVGFLAAYAFYRDEKTKFNYLFTGLFMAITLHTVFNTFIIRGEEFIKIGFTLVWVVTIGIILSFEKTKRLKDTEIKN